MLRLSGEVRHGFCHQFVLAESAGNVMRAKFLLTFSLIFLFHLLFPQHTLQSLEPLACEHSPWARKSTGHGFANDWRGNSRDLFEHWRGAASQAADAFEGLAKEFFSF